MAKDPNPRCRTCDRTRTLDVVQPAELLGVVCPACGAINTLVIEWRWTAAAVGTFSLAGAWPKVPVRYEPWLVCQAADCDFQERGQVAAPEEG